MNAFLPCYVVDGRVVKGSARAFVFAFAQLFDDVDRAEELRSFRNVHDQNLCVTRTDSS